MHDSYPKQNDGEHTGTPIAAVAGLAGGLAVQNEGGLPPAQTTMRSGYWNKPTQEQIDRAAKLGFDLTKQNKY